MEKKTPLYECHVKLGGKMVPYAGYSLPVQYETGVIKEHNAVRTACGLFDVSHMGEALITGEDALFALNHLLANRFDDMANGQVRYSVMCNEQGGIVDDLLVYRHRADRYMLVLNASNREKDIKWIDEHLTGRAYLTDLSDGIAQIALQGPRAKDILSKLISDEDRPKKYYHFTEEIDVGGANALISRTGYTGETGYELYMATADAEMIWTLLLDAGREYGLIPCGLGARDTLRLEASMPLYGHEMDEDISPLEVGLNWSVKLDHEFIGREAIEKKGSPRARVGLKVTGKGIAREHQDVFADGEKIGQTTSGTMLPYLGGAYAMALIDSGHNEPGKAVEIDVRGRCVAAEIVTLPFYKKK